MLNDPNPPALALLMAPLGALTYGAAYAVWVALLCAALVVAARALAPLVAPSERRRLAPFLFLAQPTLIALLQGQTTPLVLAAVSLALAGRTAALGAVALRPQLLPLTAAAVLRSPRALISVIAGVG
ncbi:MAG TPA: glycosyltransferase 87 family protein, partial [Candidatus Limnocylindria bacterium]|nr:glycosyltransferase 87 family protein [Candidatus Limnocylindria bacterium]